MAFVLPSKSQVGALNPDLEKEWDSSNRAVDVAEVAYNPPPPKPVMPDWSEIKTIRHLFNKTYKNNYWPTYIYNHETGESRIVKDAKEAKEFGVQLRDRTADEEARFGAGRVWDWIGDSKWRTTPKPGPRVYDPQKPEYGKEYVAAQQTPATANRQLLNTVLPEITAAVVAALRQDASVAKDIDPKDREDFLAFMAWKKTQAAIDVVASVSPIAPVSTVAENTVIAEIHEEVKPMVLGGGDDERAVWETEAKNRGIKPDGRWSLARLKYEVEKAT